MGRGKTTEVKTEKCDILGTPFRRTIQFDGSRDMFKAALPRYVVAVIGYAEASGKTLEELRDEWDRHIKEFGERTATNRKVIIFISESEVIKEEGDPGETRDDSSGRWNAKDFLYLGKLKLTFSVAFETTHGKNKEYRDGHGNRVDSQAFGGYSGFHYSVRIVDWTQERETFFRGIVDTIEKAKARMDAVFGKDDVDLLALIDAGSKNLLGFDKEDRKA